MLTKFQVSHDRRAYMISTKGCANIGKGTEGDVLIVDDNPANLRLLSEILTRKGYKVRPTASGALALTSARSILPDLILLDIKMPEINGYDICRCLKADEKTRQVPILFISALSGAADKIKGFDMGAVDYITKPFQHEEVLARVHTHISLHRMNKRLDEQNLELQKEIMERKRVEEELKKANDQLEHRVKERTLELTSANKQLKNEIAERKLAEEAIIRAKNEWEETFDAVPDLITILDNNYRILRTNKAMAKRLGVNVKETKGLTCYKYVHGTDTPPALCPYARLLKDGLDHTTADIYEERLGGWFFVSISPVNDRNGNVTRRVHIARDITALKKAEAALRESEERYRLLFENANDAVFISQDRVIKFPNPKTLEMADCSEEELAKIPFVNLIHPEDREMVLGRHRSRLKGEAVHDTYSFRLVNRSDKKLWVQINSVLIEWEGKPAVLNFLRDITREKLLETHLQQARKMEAIGTLAGGIAHDFNNILWAIIGYAEIALYHELGEGDPARYSIEQVLKASYRAKELVQQILTFSRQSEHEIKPIRVSPIVKDVMKLLRASFPSTIQIRQDLAPDPGKVMADPVQIHQIMMNLCTNAAHAMREKGGVLEVALTQIDLGRKEILRYPDLDAGSYLKIRVSDTGHGMDRLVMDRIFDPYFTTKEKEEGTGLGLAMVHGIVKGNGGAISVESNPGKGTDFTIVFPIIESRGENEAGENVPIPTGNGQILFVDDEKRLVEVAKKMLAPLGYKVVTRTNSIEALELFRAKSDAFDLVITDMTMPNMTGDILAGELLKIRPDIPIILCTGFNRQMTEKKAKMIGIREYLVKPIITREIASIIRKILKQGD